MNPSPPIKTSWRRPWLLLSFSASVVGIGQIVVPAGTVSVLFTKILLFHKTIYCE